MKRHDIESSLRSVKTVAGAFAVYQRHVLSPFALPVQVSEARIAFYAGIDWALKKLIVDAHTDAQGAEDLLASLLRETNAFGKAESEG